MHHATTFPSSSSPFFLTSMAGSPAAIQPRRVQRRPTPLPTCDVRTSPLYARPKRRRLPTQPTRQRALGVGRNLPSGSRRERATLSPQSLIALPKPGHSRRTAKHPPSQQQTLIPSPPTSPRHPDNCTQPSNMIRPSHTRTTRHTRNITPHIPQSEGDTIG